MNPHDGDGVARPRRDASTSCDFDVQSWVVAMLPVPGGHQEREEMLMAAARRAVSLLYLPIESRAIHLARLQSHHLWGRNCWDSSATERGYELVLSWAAASFGGVARVRTLHCIALSQIVDYLSLRALFTLALGTCGRARENRLRIQVLLVRHRLPRQGLSGQGLAGGA